MSPQLLLIADTAALFLLFAALGSAPVVLLMRGASTQIVAAPVAGFAVAACLLTAAQALLKCPIEWLVEAL